MDTKWKKIRNSRGVKALLIILLFAWTFTAGVSVYKTADYYGFYSTADFGDFIKGNYSGSYTNSRSNAFSKELIGDLSKLSDMVNKYKSDENVNSGAYFEGVKDDLKATTEKEIKNAIINAQKDYIEGIYQYNGEKEAYVYYKDESTNVAVLPDFSSDDQIKADETSNGITTVDGVQYYKGYPLSAAVIDEASIKKERNDNCNSQIASVKMRYLSDYNNIKKHLSSLKNLNFSVYNRTTGEVYTNIKGAEGAALESLPSMGSDWYILLQSGAVQKGDAVGSTDAYAAVIGGWNFVTLSDKIINSFDKNNYDVYISMNNEKSAIIQGDAYYTLYQDYVHAAEKIGSYIWLAAVSAVLCLLIIILLAALSGRVDEDGNTVLLSPVDKIFNDVRLVASWVIIITLIGTALSAFSDMFYNPYYYSEYQMLTVYGLCAMIALGVVLFAEWLMSVVRNARCKTYFKYTLIWTLLKDVKKLFLKVRKKFEPFYDKDIKKKIYYVFIGYFVLNAILAVCTLDRNGMGLTALFFLIALNLGFLISARSSVKALDNMMQALSEAEQGKFDFNLDVNAMPRYLRPFGNQINNLRNGIKLAVDEAIRGERMKTELITNVSHDLKTPLTSIITYVDLLKRCEIKDKTAAEYIGVLEEKSDRLKKLIEDLVEASKASTGNINLSITRVNLNEMALQLSGENEEALKALGIELIMNVPQEAVIVNADGQKTYRVLENLFSNVKKYALEGTRVYIDVSRAGNYGIITVKNVSRNALSMSAEELTQRFVRGDESRTGEGSGLGLSIAESLVRLQKGEFKVEIDGDLFKAVIKLPV